MERAEQTPQIITARELGLVCCRRCNAVWDKSVPRCARCGHNLRSRDIKCLQRVWAFWLVGLMCYIPANVYPMLQTRTLFFTQENTIVGGAIEMIQHGSYGVAIVILLASVAIPLGKFLAIAYLALSVQHPSKVPNHQRQVVHEIVEYIGRWSMVDIFVVAILSSLVQLKALASMNPGPASLFFALSVIFTMLSAQAFDSRLIWDARQVSLKGTADE